MNERTCIVSRTPAPEAERIRFARAPDGAVVPDLQRKLPGRGVWVSLSRKVVAEAVRRKAFDRGFAAPCQVPDGLADQVGQLLRGQAVSHLALARKAGQAVAGATKVEEALGRGPVRILLNAVEASPGGRQKISRLAQAETLVCNLLQEAEMSLAFGRANVIHAAVAAGGLADRLAVLLQRMAHYDDLDVRGQQGQS